MFKIINLLAYGFVCAFSHAGISVETFPSSDKGICIVRGSDTLASDFHAIKVYLSEIRIRSSVEIQVVDESELELEPHRKRTLIVVGKPASSKLVSTWLDQQSEKLPPDGYALEISANVGCLNYVAGESQSGLLAGLGRLLRLMRFTDEKVRFPIVSERDYPRMPTRGMYLATHFHNYYEEASAEEISQLLADMALWGANDLAFNYPSHQSAKLSAPGSMRILRLLKHMNGFAKTLGMRTSLLQNPIFIRNNTPIELQGVEIPGVWHKGYEVCPSTTEGLALIAQGANEMLDEFDHLDTLITWPYDGGGCGCSECMPWGGKGFIKASRAFADEFHAKFPEGKVIISTWWFDRPAIPALQDDFLSLFNYIEKESPTWFDGFLTGENKQRMQTQLLKRPDPEQYPLTCFPEIAMHRMQPWGGFGANPLPQFNEDYGKLMREVIVGGWPYSEGIYDDVNKFYWLRYFWNPEQSADEILTEYATYYLTPEVAEDAVELFHLLEQTMPQSDWDFGDPDDVRLAWKLAQGIDARLPAWSKHSWRWRLLYIRAEIAGLVEEHGTEDPQARESLQKYRDEIRQIYHVANSTAHNLAGFKVPKLGANSNLALGCDVKASSTHPSVPSDSALRLIDSIRRRKNNFWLHDPAEERTPYVLIDLKKSCSLAAIKLHLYGREGRYSRVPRSVTVEVSLDGRAFEPATVYLNENPEPIAIFLGFPNEDCELTKEPVRFGIHTQARYVRLRFGESHHETKEVGLEEIVILGRPL